MMACLWAKWLLLKKYKVKASQVHDSMTEQQEPLQQNGLFFLLGNAASLEL